VCGADRGSQKPHPELPGSAGFFFRKLGLAVRNGNERGAADRSVAASPATPRAPRLGFDDERDTQRDFR